MPIAAAAVLPNTESLVNIEYRPPVDVPLPVWLCVDSHCVIPHFDIQGHSVSVEWLLNRSTHSSVSVNSTGVPTGVTWRIPKSSKADCYILTHELLAPSTDDDDDPLLNPARACEEVIATYPTPRLVTMVCSGMGWIGNYIRRLAEVIATLLVPLITGLTLTATDLASMDIATWSLLLGTLVVSSIIGLWMKPPAVVSTGMVRVGRLDGRPQFIQLPSAQFPDLSDAAIHREMAVNPTISSITVFTK